MEEISDEVHSSQKYVTESPSIHLVVGKTKIWTIRGGSKGTKSWISTPFIFSGILIFIVVCLASSYFLDFFLSKFNPPNPRYPPGPSISELHIFDKAAVCTHAPPCADIGRYILEIGGSAVDATIATMVCNGAWAMQSMGLGGGFLMVIYDKKENKTYALNAREKAPTKVTPEMYEANPNISRHGPLAIGVPGEVMGYYEAHKRFGKLSFAKLIEPSIELCYRGIEVTSHTIYSLIQTDVTGDENLKYMAIGLFESLPKRMEALVYLKRGIYQLTKIVNNEEQVSQGIGLTTLVLSTIYLFFIIFHFGEPNRKL